MASTPPTDPDPRTAADDKDAYLADATEGRGVSSTDPAEGSDSEPGEQDGSPKG